MPRTSKNLVAGVSVVVESKVAMAGRLRRGGRHGRKILKPLQHQRRHLMRSLKTMADICSVVVGKVEGEVEGEAAGVATATVAVAAMAHIMEATPMAWAGRGNQGENY